MPLGFLGLRAASSVRVLARTYPRPHLSNLSSKAFSSNLRAQAAVSSNGGSSNAEPDLPSSLDAVDVEEYSSRPAPARTTPPAPSPTPFVESLIDSSPDASGTDWSKSYHGLSSQPFSAEIAEVLQAALDPNDVEMKPDGIVYLPEIKYRRILNKAFGPGGWGLAPRSETNVGPKVVSREYALVCLGRLVAVARGEQEYFDPNGIPTATEGCKSNALMRCCKDIGIASELWDPRFIREFKQKHCVEVFVEHVTTKRKRKLWRRKDQKFEYPYKE